MREAVNILVQLFHPMMPHLAEECWAALGHDTLVAQAPWPQVERDLLVEDTMTLPVQINGKKRADVTVARNAGDRRNRDCRSRARCGKEGAGRQAAEKGDHRAAADRQRGGVSFAGHEVARSKGRRTMVRSKLRVDAFLARPDPARTGRAGLRSGRRPGQRARQRPHQGVGRRPQRSVRAGAARRRGARRQAGAGWSRRRRPFRCSAGGARCG